MAAEDSTWDVIVIGMGVMGSSTAYFLAKEHGKVYAKHSLSLPLSSSAVLTMKAMQRVLCLEQFDLGHSRGSSHGHTRILRKVYNEDHFTKVGDNIA